MDDALLNEFINESREHLSTIEADLLTIEEGGADIDEDLVNKVFRAAHSIKGGSSFFGLTRVKELAHKAETVLDMLRGRRMTPNAEVTNVLLSAFDKLREMINRPGESDRADTTDLLVGLTGLASSYLPAGQKDTLTRQVELHREDGRAEVTLPQVDFERARRAGQCVYRVDYDLIHDLEQRQRTPLQVFRELEECGEILDCTLDFAAVGTLDGPIANRLPLRLVYATTVASHMMPELLVLPEDRIRLLFDPLVPGAVQLASAPSPVEAGLTAPCSLPPVTASVPVPTESEPNDGEPTTVPTAQRVDQESRGPAVNASKAGGSDKGPGGSGVAGAEETLRVNVTLLEDLMNLAGELVLSRNQLRSAIAQNDQQSLGVAGQRLHQVTSDLQDAIMRTRLQPIGNVFGKFPRVVRDMANALHKEIQLDIRGKDVALDRSLIEGLSDPLTHMVRNAVDHGIESPEERLRGGKKSLGQLRIEARHEAGQVVVEIADDGKGIHAQKVADSAVARGLVSAEKVRTMSEAEKMALVFLPGLSTAEKVTDLSGRGVGMDVVKTNLDRLGGKVEIESEPGKGSIFRIKLPLTLAIISSLIVSVGKERFAIPQINVEELLRIRAEDVSKRIEVVGQAEVLMLRDQILPLVRFADLLAKDKSEPKTGAGGDTAGGALEVAVVTTGTLRFGLVVSAFHDTEEIVVKPLGRHLKGLREYAGATILGDGTVALILDVGGLAAKAELAGVAENRRATEEEAETSRAEDLHALLLFHSGPDEVCATPLDTVLRIERIRPDEVETLGARRTMQYRGASLPLVTLSDVAQLQSLEKAHDLAVIVSNVRGREVGLLGAMPVDVVEAKASIDQSTHRQKGISGSAIIRERTTLIADVFELVDAVYPEWGGAEETLRSLHGATAKANPTVLLAEDSDFFRSQVKKFLEQDGFVVLDAPDGEAAWELLVQNAERVTALVTDIEMPRLTGLGLAQRIRADARFARLPIIALSSLAGEEDIAKGKAAGIDEYQVKLDRDALVAGVRAVATAA